MRASLGIVALLLVLVASGCAGPDVIVTDMTGKPIESAKVTGTSLSIGGQFTLTNAKGEASIPKAAQATKWIAVSKEGYSEVRLIDVSQPKPILVKLAPSKKGG